jgi:hypothetical protein
VRQPLKYGLCWHAARQRRNHKDRLAAGCLQPAEHSGYPIFVPGADRPRHNRTDDEDDLSARARRFIGCHSLDTIA